MRRSAQGGLAGCGLHALASVAPVKDSIDPAPAGREGRKGMDDVRAFARETLGLFLLRKHKERWDDPAVQSAPPRIRQGDTRSTERSRERELADSCSCAWALSGVLRSASPLQASSQMLSLLTAASGVSAVQVPRPWRGSEHHAACTKPKTISRHAGGSGMRSACSLHLVFTSNCLLRRGVSVRERLTSILQIRKHDGYNRLVRRAAAGLSVGRCSQRWPRHDPTNGVQRLECLRMRWCSPCRSEWHVRSWTDGVRGLQVMITRALACQPTSKLMWPALYDPPSAQRLDGTVEMALATHQSACIAVEAIEPTVTRNAQHAVSEDLIKAQMDRMVSLGLLQAGYVYFNLDGVLCSARWRVCPCAGA